MEADSRLRRLTATLAARTVCLLVAHFAVLAATTAMAANFRTQNFLIQAPDPELARAVGEAAERYRNDLATYWLGHPLPTWPTPCPVRVVAGPNLAAQGVTTYNRAPVRDFQMEVVGTPERILDSVLPHEVTHTVLATHFGRPLPRWADEGICTTVEHESEKNKHEAKLREFLSTRRGIAMNQLFLLTEYPNDVLPMYAQGYSVCRFLIEQKDAPTFIAFLTDYMSRPSWTENVKKHYGYDSLAELQQYWLAWVGDGSGPVERFAKADPNRPPTPNRQPAPDPQAFAASNAIARNDFQLNAASPLSVPSSTVRPAAAVGPTMALASISGDGFYQRKRREAVSGDPGLAAAPTPTTPMVPPSVRASGQYNDSRYKSAQPQPEFQLSRGGRYDARFRGSEANDLTNWADGSARFR